MTRSYPGRSPCVPRWDRAGGGNDDSPMRVEKSDHSIVAMKPSKEDGAKGVTEMKRAERRQLNFAFADQPEEGRGQAKAPGVPEVKAWLRQIAKSKESNQSAARVDSPKAGLLEQVASSPNLAKALLNVVGNNGAAGVDGKSVKEVLQNVRALLPKLQHALLKETYRPGDIRRVWLPKPGGGERGLGIPTVIDRWVQEATRHVLEPMFELHFHPSSHGFRPKRGAQTAIAEAKRHIEEGREVVVAWDLSTFFDRVNHQRLLNRLAQKAEDGRVLKLIHRRLKAKVVMPDGAVITVKEGTPQGGPLSPLLSSGVLDELDWELERRGLSCVRYADEANIYVHSERAGDRVMDSTRRFIEKRLRVKVNEEKSSVTSPDKVHFLGFCFRRSREGTLEVHLSERSNRRISVRIRELTPRKWGQSLERCLSELNTYLRGWEAYFGGIGTRGGAYRFHTFDGHIRRRLRALIIRQKRRPRHLHRHLKARGVRGEVAARAAFAQRGTRAVLGLCIRRIRMHGSRKGFIPCGANGNANTPKCSRPRTDNYCCSPKRWRSEEPDVWSTSPVL